MHIESSGGGVVGRRPAGRATPGGAIMGSAPGDCAAACRAAHAGAGLVASGSTDNYRLLFTAGGGTVRMGGGWPRCCRRPFLKLTDAARPHSVWWGVEHRAPSARRTETQYLCVHFASSTRDWASSCVACWARRFAKHQSCGGAGATTHLRRARGTATVRKRAQGSRPQILLKYNCTEGFA